VNPLAWSIPVGLLPEEPALRDQALTQYFAERIPNSVLDGDGGWQVSLDVPPTADFYIDPALDRGLTWWGCTVADIPFAYRTMQGIFVSLSDAWTLLSASRWLADQASSPVHLTIIHLDDHDDLMCPRLAAHENRFADLLTGHPVDMRDPTSVEAAINSGAIGMGSFLVPLLHTLPFIDIRHLCDTNYARERTDRYWLVRTYEVDKLLDPRSRRPSVRLDPIVDPPTIPDQTVGTYQVRHDEIALLADLGEGPILLHIDLDFFNNRFDGDSDWLGNSHRHDPTKDQVMRRVDEILDALTPLRHRIVDVAIGISPGFFPAELWQVVCGTLVDRLEP
jgi:hypothetical protein